MRDQQRQRMNQKQRQQQLSTVALTADQQPRGKRRGRRHGDRLKHCYRCGTDGHITHECSAPAPVPRLQQHKSGKDISTYVALNTVASHANISSVSWIIELGASAHMANNAAIFRPSSTSRCAGETIKIGNGNTISVEARGDIESLQQWHEHLARMVHGSSKRC